RKIESEEKTFLTKHNIKVFSEIYNMEAAADYITEKANSHDLYISIDIDALDPAFAPAVSYPEPNGLTPKEFFYILNRLLKIKSLKAIDIVEIVPEKDKNFDNRTLRTTAKIIEEASFKQ
ncbi:MAG TPA: agmatinase, partial [Candidatus Pacearchaeota archaeon]|nr:agmatinase [Candidatus Pacearchaeota archaeon]